MPTNKITLKTVEEFMSDYVPIYKPIYGLFLGKSQQYAAEVGRMDFKRVEAIGDIRQKRITPKDTEIKQINVTDTKKSFKKYYFANQYVISDLQDQEGTSDVIAQVLDEHHIQMDEILLTGDGTSPGTVVNNGLYYSNDVNYVLETSFPIPVSGRLEALHQAVAASVTKANKVAGRKLVLFYGDDLIPYYNAIYPTSSRPWKTVLQEVLGANVSLAEIPEDANPEGLNGWIVVNLDQLKMHYTLLPELSAQGENEERMYHWFNFKMGSVMMEVLQKFGVIRQPITFAS